MQTNDIDIELRYLLFKYGKEQIYVLTDENAKNHCLPLLLNSIQIDDKNIMVLPSGEEHKNLQTTCLIWDFLQTGGATRKSLLVCLGGGVITDMGGFAASTFKRGINYVNIPTTLLSAVDAATGGKTGIDYNGLKNQIGLFSMPEKTIIYTPFFQTLPHEQFLSGWAEMLKHALIASPLELINILAFNLDEIDYSRLAELVNRSNTIKEYIVEQDPEEKGLRKTLNFGHTIGHALEEYSLNKPDKQPMLHGYAVMYGMVAELYISIEKLGFPQKTLTDITHLMIENYGKPICSCKDYDKLIELMRHDKKNTSADCISFTLLKNVGNARIDQIVKEQEIKEALDFLFNL